MIFGFSRQIYLLQHHQIKTEIKQWKGLLPAKTSGMHHPSNILMYSREMLYKWWGSFFLFKEERIKMITELWKIQSPITEPHHSSFRKHLGGINSCSLIATFSSTMLRAERRSWLEICLQKDAIQSYSPLTVDNRVSPQPGEMGLNQVVLLLPWNFARTGRCPHKAKWMKLYVIERTPWHAQ